MKNILKQFERDFERVYKKTRNLDSHETQYVIDQYMESNDIDDSEELESIIDSIISKYSTLLLH